jgi:peptidoglycan hydrolase-like protein with peptidoglycan-binding domain
MLPELAAKTAEGMKRYFEPSATANTTKILPAAFSSGLSKAAEPQPDVLRLQALLQKEGVYPPAGETLSSCPLSAVFGRCTALAVTAFQKKYSIPSTGKVDDATLAQLNDLAGR